MILNCIILDNKTNKQLEEHIVNTPFLYLERKYLCLTEALDYISENRIELLFINADIFKTKHIQILNKLNYTPLIILLSQNNKKNLLSGIPNVIGSLVKPIGYSEFLKIAVNAIKLNYLQTEIVPQNQKEKVLFIKSEYKIIRIEVDSIKYIEGMNEYVRIHRVGGKPIMTLLSLKSIEKQLPNDSFMRTHRSYIVNLKKIQEIEANTIICEDGKLIPVSRMYKDVFQNYLNASVLM